MALTLRTVLEAARNRNRYFDPKRMPAPPVVSFLSDYQRQLLSLAQERYPLLIVSQMSILFNAQRQIQLSQIGAGTPESNGGLPANQNPDGSVSQVALPSGSSVDVNASGPILSQGTTASATANTLTPNLMSPAWTQDQFDGTAYVVITAGTGLAQIRLIQSNTTTTLTVSDPWTVVPDTTSTWQIIATQPSVDSTTGMVVSLPSLSTRTSYLTYLDANGNVYLDLSNALSGTFDVGIPLPDNKSLLGGTIYFQPTNSPGGFVEPRTEDLMIVDYADRLQCWGRYAVYEMNGQLFPIGNYATWLNVQSIDLRYVPVPPDFDPQNDTATFLLGLDARGALVERTAEFMGLHVMGDADVPENAIPIDILGANATKAEELWLQQVASRKRVFTSRVEDVWS